MKKFFAFFAMLTTFFVVSNVWATDRPDDHEMNKSLVRIFQSLKDANITQVQDTIAGIEIITADTSYTVPINRIGYAVKGPEGQEGQTPEDSIYSAYEVKLDLALRELDSVQKEQPQYRASNFEITVNKTGDEKYETSVRQGDYTYVMSVNCARNATGYFVWVAKTETYHFNKESNVYDRLNIFMFKPKLDATWFFDLFEPDRTDIEKDGQIAMKEYLDNFEKMIVNAINKNKGDVSNDLGDLR